MLTELPVLLDAARVPPLEALSISGPGSHGGTWAPEQVALAARLVELPKLTRLSMRIDRHPWRADDFAWLWESPVARHVKHLELKVNLPFDLVGFLGALRSSSLASFALDHSYFTFLLTRDLRGEWSRLSVSWRGVTNAASYLTYVATPIRALPPDALTAFRFEHPTARWTAAALKPLTNAVARQKRLAR